MNKCLTRSSHARGVVHEWRQVLKNRSLDSFASWCVYVCVWYLCVFVCLCVHVYTEAGGQWSELSPNVLIQNISLHLQFAVLLRLAVLGCFGLWTLTLEPPMGPSWLVLPGSWWSDLRPSCLWGKHLPAWTISAALAALSVWINWGSGGWLIATEAHS